MATFRKIGKGEVVKGAIERLRTGQTMTAEQREANKAFGGPEKSPDVFGPMDPARRRTLRPAKPMFLVCKHCPTVPHTSIGQFQGMISDAVQQR